MLLLLTPLVTAFGQENVLIWHNDVARTGQYLAETTLTPANVNSSTFGKLFTLAVDGRVDAQTLYVSAVAIPGQGTHNVLYVVTEHDSAYAFDADGGAPLWHVSLLKAGESPSDDRGCGQVSPEIGITSTPVIDLSSGPHGTMYVVSMSKDGSGNYHQRLHALDLTTGAEEFSGPVDVQATYPGTGDGSNNGTVIFDPKQYKDRAGLLIVNGVVYTSWASHCDIQPYTAWVIGYNEATLAQVSVIDLTPNGSEGSVWGAGAGPAADAAGNLYMLIANGTFDTHLTAGGFPVNGDYGNGFVKLSTTNSSLAVADYFNMSNTVSESNADEDLGSGGALLMPPVEDSQGRSRALAVGAGKDGHIYVVDRNGMGKFDPNGDVIYQELPSAVGSVFSSPAWFNGTLYYGGSGDTLKAFSFSNGMFASTPTSKSSLSYTYPGATPSISANGSANAIVWAAENQSTAVLHAYDASDLSKELYNSNQAANGRDHFGTGNKYIVPTVANGKVYVGTASGVGAFGLLCNYAITTTTASFSASGGAGTVDVTASNGCVWSAAANASFLTITAGASGSGNGSASYTVAANSGAARNGTLTVAGKTFTVSQAAAAASPPVPISVSPASGSGMSQTFVATYSAGSAPITLAYFMVNSAVISPLSCFVEYNPATNGYRLLNDAGTTWSATVPVGAGTASNSQCTISGAGGGSTLSGSNLTVNFPITFNSAYAGAQNVFLLAIDSAGRNSGWLKLGTWTVPGTGGSLPPGAIPACNQSGAPCVASLTASGSGLSGTFTGLFTHSGGAGQHYLGYILFLPTPNIVFYTATGSCLVEYNRISDAMRLINDAGTGWLPGALGIPMSQGGTLSNSHCTVDVTNSSAKIDGTLMTLTAKVTFAAGFTGQLATFLQAFDMSGAFTSMTQFGNWMASPATVRPPGPYVVGVSPTSGTGTSTTLSFTAGHTSGVSALSFVTMLISPVITGGEPCQVFYFQASNTLNLVNDAGTAMVSTTGIVPGTPGTLANSRCSINTGGATEAISGDNVTVSVPMTFDTATFGGKQSVYVNAFDDYGFLSHWVTGGSWTVP